MRASDLDQAFLPDPVPEPVLRPRWATVTQTDPLRVQLAGDAAPLPFTPVDLAGGHTLGDRVFCLLSGRQLIVLGRRTN